ncbi:MAG TPA: hypothetical protein VFB20_12495 [Burkholderiales bacterium]|nr:hypothetical protein [Burkholderiales bacterium]
MASVFALSGLFACGRTAEASGEPRAAKTSKAEFALYALSRGKGVPEPARSALKKARTLLEDAKRRGEVSSLKEARIGLEGETRLCVQAKDAAAARTLLREVRAIAEGVELFNVVEEPCMKK